jgi:hypothetical protein
MELTSTVHRVPTDIWQFQAQLGRRLVRWGRLSVIIGAVLALVPSRFWRGFGSQAAGWGAIDAAIGWLGLRGARAKASVPANHERQAQQEAQHKLRRLLLINASLDIGYVAGGIALARTKGRESDFWRGSGWSVVVQGSFLLLFDLVHALLLG